MASFGPFWLRFGVRVGVRVRFRVRVGVRVRFRVRGWVGSSHRCVHTAFFMN